MAEGCGAVFAASFSSQMLEAHSVKSHFLYGAVLQVTRHVVSRRNIEGNIGSIAENVMKDAKRCLVLRIRVVFVWQREVPFRVRADECVENKLCD